MVALVDVYMEDKDDDYFPPCIAKMARLIIIISTLECILTFILKGIYIRLFLSLEVTIGKLLFL